MKRLLIGLLILFGLAAPVALVSPVGAVDVLNPDGTEGPCSNSSATADPSICKDNESNATSNPIVGKDGILTSLVRVLSLIVGVASVIIIIVSGLRMVLASGDSGTESTARRSIVYALAGLIIALLAQGIVALVLSKL
jgi:hypothetical protein